MTATFLNIVTKSATDAEQARKTSQQVLAPIVPTIPASVELDPEVTPELERIIKILTSDEAISTIEMGVGIADTLRKGDPASSLLSEIPTNFDRLISALLDIGEPETAELVASKFGVAITSLPPSFWKGLASPQLLATLRAIAMAPNSPLLHRQLAALAALSLAYGEGVYDQDANLRPRNWHPGQPIKMSSSGMFGLTDAGYAEGLRLSNDKGSEAWIPPSVKSTISEENRRAIIAAGRTPVSRDRINPGRDLNYPFASAALLLDNTREVLTHFTFSAAGKEGKWVSIAKDRTSDNNARYMVNKMGRLRWSLGGGFIWLMVLYHTKSKYSALRNKAIPHPERASKDPVVGELLLINHPLLSIIIGTVRKPVQLTSNLLKKAASNPQAMTSVLARLQGDPSDDERQALIRQWNTAVIAAYSIRGGSSPMGTAFLKSNDHRWGIRTTKKKGTRMHYGLDLRARVPLAVFAPADGIVKLASFGGGWGRYMDVSHFDLPYTSRFAHLSRVIAPVKMRVYKGMIIAVTGSTQTDAPHLHYETWSHRSNKRVNPEDTGLEWKNIVNSQ